MIVEAFTKQHFFNGKEFREVPGHIRLASSQDGEILRLNNFGYPEKILGQYKVHNTIVSRRSNETYYLCVRYRSPKGTKHITGAHILVCLAWNGLPPQDGKRYDVNHKNSIKIDNFADNLEWSTRSQNISHCFDEGMNSAAIRIIETDILSEETRTFRSIKQFAEVFGLHRINVRSFIAKHTEVPFNGKVYKVEEPREFKIKASRYQSKSVAYKDYEKNVIVITESIEQASIRTAIQSSTIKEACNRFEIKGKVRPVRQFFFQYLTSDMKFPEFTKEEIASFEVEFFKRSNSAKAPRKQSQSERFPSIEI